MVLLLLVAINKAARGEALKREHVISHHVHLFLSLGMHLLLAEGLTVFRFRPCSHLLQADGLCGQGVRHGQHPGGRAEKRRL